MFDLSRFFQNKKEAVLAKDELAELLKTTPEALKAFEDAYQAQVLDAPNTSENLFDALAKEASTSFSASEDIPLELVERIVQELLEQSVVYEYSQQQVHHHKRLAAGGIRHLSNQDLTHLPVALRPEMTGHLMKIDLPDSSKALFFHVKQMMNPKVDPKTRQQHYHFFRQGLDILDLDPIVYETLSKNPNSIGNWFPQLVDATLHQTFFKLPNTKILKVPMTLLQLTRLPYHSLSPTTVAALNQYVHKVFDLDDQGDYFIKTGTYSSKFEFRNAHVHDPQEIREIGQYLLFIHYQALQMASPLNNRSIYGVSTTNEWVVRDFIPDVENNPTIYKGMPLRTEYRVFVDCDTDQIIGVNPYWDPAVMKQRFGHEDDANSPHQMHDYVIYKMHEESLMQKYHDNKDRVLAAVQELLPHLNLSGQWSIDVMQNSDDFYIIDMALAETSAFYECVPKELRHASPEDWLPKLTTPTK